MTQKRIIYILATLVLSAIGCTHKDSSTAYTQDTYTGIEFDMSIIPEPIIPDYSVSIIEFGAKSGGQILNTEAFAKAINAVSQKGGGKVIIPPGIWLTGPIILESHLELHAQQGALILFSTNKDLYPIIETNFEGLDTWRCLSPIYANKKEDIAFTGKGIWDANGDVWRAVKKGKLNESQWKTLIASGGFINKKGNVWYPSEEFKKGAEGSGDQNVRSDLKTKEEFENIKDYLRPVFVSVKNCKRVMFDGPVFQNSPAWNIHPLWTENLIVRNVTVRNPWYSQNGDGLDVESCKNVLVQNCHFDVGDDAICIKSGKNEDGRRHNIPCENIIIKDNIVYHGHGGVTVGSEMSGGVRNVHISNCTFISTDVGLRFKSTRGRGGVVENIYISNIQMKDIPTNAISFNLYYRGRSVSEKMAEGELETSNLLLPVTVETPQFKNIKISDLTVSGAKQAVYLQGLPEMNLENIELNNLYLDVDKGFKIIDATGIQINNVSLNIKSHEAMSIYNCKDLSISGLTHNSSSDQAITINGEGCQNILFKTDSENMKSITSIGKEVKKKAVIF